MALHHSPRVVTDGLVLCLDAASKESYPGSGTVWRDLAGSNNGALTNGPTFSNVNGGSLVFDGVDDHTSFTYAQPAYNTTDSFTWNIWVYPTRNSNLDVLIGNRAGDLWTKLTTNNFEYAPIVFGGAMPINIWQNVCVIKNQTNFFYYRNSILIASSTSSTTKPSNPFYVGGDPLAGEHSNSRIAQVLVYNRALTVQEILQNYDAIKSRFVGELGSFNNPFPSPVFAQNNNVPAGSYYFRSVGMSSPLLLEYQPSYYESKPFCCVFRSPYGSTATTNRIDLNIPMGGLLVQRDALDLRAAVYWSTPITYNSVGGSGNNTADSGYSPRRVMLGFGGGHGIYNINQNQCSWGSSLGGIGAGFDGGTCGTFPDNLVWGTGNNTNTYENRSGTWSHWITWG